MCVGGGKRAHIIHTNQPLYRLDLVFVKEIGLGYHSHNSHHFMGYFIHKSCSQQGCVSNSKLSCIYTILLPFYRYFFLEFVVSRPTPIFSWICVRPGHHSHLFLGVGGLVTFTFLLLFVVCRLKVYTHFYLYICKVVRGEALVTFSFVTSFGNFLWSF